MSITTIELYDALVSAGIKEDKAKAAAEAVLSRAEAEKVLVTKDDLLKHTKWIAGLLLGQVAAITAIMALFFNYYN